MLNTFKHIRAINVQAIGSANLWLLECGNEGWND